MCQPCPVSEATTDSERTGPANATAEPGPIGDLRPIVELARNGAEHPG